MTTQQARAELKAIFPAGTYISAVESASIYSSGREEVDYYVNVLPPGESEKSAFHAAGPVLADCVARVIAHAFPAGKVGADTAELSRQVKEVVGA